MKKLLSILAIASVALFFTSCDDGMTDLEITVRDSSGSVSFVSVGLYSSQDDFINGRNRRRSATTNSSGVATFRIESGTRYYVRASSGCRDNFALSFGTPPSAVAMANTVFGSARTVDLRPIGTVVLVNNSSNPYRVFQGNIQVAELPGNTSRTFTNMNAGLVSLRAVQVSGFVLWPTERTFSNTLTCGGTLTFRFPN